MIKKSVSLCSAIGAVAIFAQTVSAVGPRGPAAIPSIPHFTAMMNAHMLNMTSMNAAMNFRAFSHFTPTRSSMGNHLRNQRNTHLHTTTMFNTPVLKTPVIKTPVIRTPVLRTPIFTTPVFRSGVRAPTGTLQTIQGIATAPRTATNNVAPVSQRAFISPYSTASTAGGYGSIGGGGGGSGSMSSLPSGGTGAGANPYSSPYFFPTSALNNLLADPSASTSRSSTVAGDEKAKSGTDVQKPNITP